jgi:formylglycine-generating enzyme required for sulfatase activity
MATDASKIRWGCTINDTPTGGHWTPEEAANHINYFEIKAVLLGFKSFAKVVAGQHVKVLVDNTTAVSCINQVGTCHSKGLNDLVIGIWEWCIKHDVWITVAHIPGAESVIADQESRKVRSEIEWALDTPIFHMAVEKIGFQPDIDFLLPA